MKAECFRSCGLPCFESIRRARQRVQSLFPELYRKEVRESDGGVVIIRSLNDTKTELKNRGKTTDAVDDLIIKFGYAPKKKFKVVERKDCSCRESR